MSSSPAMRQFTLEIAETLPCRACGKEVPVGLEVCRACGEHSVSIGFDEFFAMLERGEVVNAQQGGLVIGRDHPDDDIPLFQFAGAGIFRMCGCMQGGEYLMGVDATAKHRDRLVAINSEKGSYTPLTTLPVTARTSVINVNLCSPTASLWLNPRGQFVVNRFATIKYLDELERLNGIELSS